MERKLFEVRLRKTCERLRADVRALEFFDGPNISGAVYGLEFATPIAGPLPSSTYAFLRHGSDAALVADVVREAALSGGDVITALAQSGAIVIDFDQDRDLLTCHLISKQSETLSALFQEWVDPKAEGLIS